MANPTKQQLVHTIVEKLQDKHSFFLVKFEKTGHKTLESLRRELKKSKGCLEVVKNSLFLKAVNKLSLKDKTYQQLKKRFFPLKQNTAVISFEQDWAPGIKTFFDFMKKEGTLEFKCGVIENQPYGNEELLALAKLPPREELFVKVLGSLRSPTARLVYAMKFNINKLVIVLRR